MRPGRALLRRPARRAARALASLVALAVLLAGCSHRDRANPFDPANPDTRGRPVGFVALAGNGVVTLRWAAASAAGLEGFRLYRRSAGESDYRAISGLIRAGTTSFIDSEVLNGVDQHYRLYFSFTDGRAGLPAEDVATPGPLRVFVAEIDAHRVARITPDGRRVLTSYGPFDAPTHVAFNARTGVLWVSDPLHGEIVLLQPNSGVRITVGDARQPGAIALDPPRGEGWVCDARGDLVHHLTETGARLAPQLGTVVDPLAAAVDVHDGSVWVCENAGGVVRRFSRAGGLLAAFLTLQPSRVAVDSLTRDAWVTSLSQGRVFRLDPTGFPLDTVTVAAGPVGVAVDHRRGRIWIADPAGAQVIALARDGTLQARAQGIDGPSEIEVDLATGDAWVTCPDAGQLLRLSPGGAILQRLSGFLGPYGIALSNP